MAMAAVTATALVLLVLAAGCGPSGRPSVADLRATLPTSVAGQAFDLVQVVDDNLNVGHPIDDVLAKLFKSRGEASVVFLDSSRGVGTLGAAAVSGVEGDTLLAATVATWNAPAVVGRSEHMLGGRSVWLIEERGGFQTYVYARGPIIYFAAADDAEVARVLLDALPISPSPAAPSN
jgi:hypothetical protein